MACFIPVSTKIRESFLRRIELDTPLPARSPSEQEISGADIRVYRHTATASCDKNQWLALRGLVASCQGDNASAMPRGRELNEDKIVFTTYRAAGLYCGLDKTDLCHLQGPMMVQGKVWYRIPGPLTRTQVGIAPMGISLHTS